MCIYREVWDLDTLECKGTLTCNSDVRELVINNRRLYSGCGNGTIQVTKTLPLMCLCVKVWDLDTLKCTAAVRRHEEDVLSLKFVGDQLWSGSSDGTIKVISRCFRGCL
jgi:WD40 repeat protein